MTQKLSNSQSVFPSVVFQPGDLVFFHRLPKQVDDFEQAIMSSSLINDNIYHVAVVISEHKIVHATVEPGVQIEFLADAVNDLQPDLVELTSVNLDAEWKERASLWAQQQVGAEYNDIFSHKMINSRGKRAFYCCQLVEEAYKATSAIEKKNPFLPHKMNFLDANGKMIPYWIDYYKRLCPENPTVPQGEPGSHASILRASPGVELVASRAFDFSAQAENKE